PSDDFIMRNAMDAEEVAIGWWPGDPRYGQAALYAYAHPAPEGFGGADLRSAGGRWEEELGYYVLDWSDVEASANPRETAVAFARGAFQHACAVCGWDEALSASGRGATPPVH
ncbi:MAG TPA: DUF5996 family protein, partial [Solirubrobacteraceae bacterium]